METTYDPITGGPESLSRFLFRRLPPPRLGLALVLVTASGELVTFDSGAPIQAPVINRFRTAYWIDTAEHQLFLEAQLPSSDPAFVFLAHLSYRTQVSDPAAIAARQIRDVGELVRPHLVGAMRAATRRLDIAAAAEAEERIERGLERASADPAVTVSNCHVELPVQADEAASSGRSFRDTTRSLRISSMKARQVRELLAGGSPDLLALHLAHHPEDTGAVIEMIVAGDIAEGRNMLQAISIMYSRSGSEDEPFDSQDERRKLMDRFLARALPASGPWDTARGDAALSAPAEAPRLAGSRLRGSLARSAEPPVIGGSVIDTAAKDHGARSPTPEERSGSGGPEAGSAPAGRRPAPARPRPPADPDLDEEA